MELLRAHEATTGGPDAYSVIMHTELEKRLTEPAYLTCTDFSHFEARCCCTCHGEPHYMMIDVVLSDGRHAWVCDTIRDILIRQTKAPPPLDDPEWKAKDRLLKKIFGWKRDPVEDRIHVSNMKARSDEEKLYYCIKYAHYRSGIKRSRKQLKALVDQALSLPGGQPAIKCNESNPPPDSGFCLRCGAGIYEENLIPGTSFHNCKDVRELLRKT
jgi:hypothetical protein